MDTFDKVTIVAVAICLLVAIGMLGQEELLLRSGQGTADAALKEQEAYAVEVALNQQIYKDVSVAMEKGDYQSATDTLEDVIKKYPGRSFSQVMLARLSLKKGNMGEAITHYRKAVEVEPDYIDKKTPLFVGNEIKELVKEGLEKFSREKKLRPKDKTVAQTLKNIYYLQRRLLGGCE